MGDMKAAFERLWNDEDKRNHALEFERKMFDSKLQKLDAIKKIRELTDDEHTLRKLAMMELNVYAYDTKWGSFIGEEILQKQLECTC